MSLIIFCAKAQDGYLGSGQWVAIGGWYISLIIFCAKAQDAHLGSGWWMGFACAHPCALHMFLLKSR
jgi:hypothetical protein